MVLIIVGLSAAVVGAYGPMLSPGFVQVSADLGITIEVLAQATAWLILTIGLSLFITNPVAKVIGRRPVYIFAILIMFATSVWGAAVTTYDSFLASRIIAGIGMVSFLNEPVPKVVYLLSLCPITSRLICDSDKSRHLTRSLSNVP